MKIKGFSLALLSILLVSFATTIGSPQTIRAEENQGIRIYSTFVTRGVNSATIEWKTDPATKDKIEYADESGEWQSTPWQESFTKDHLMTILNLKPDTSYLYRINAENEPGELKTYRSNFNTLESKILGDQQNTASGTSGFQSVLSPTPTLALSQPNSIDAYSYPSVLGQQNTLPAPFVQNIYPQVLSAITSAPTKPEIAEPTPVPEESNLSGLNLIQNNSTTLLLGVTLGILMAILVHQLATKSNTETASSSEKHILQTEPRKEKKKKFKFSIGENSRN